MNKTEIILENGTQLDVTEGITIPLTYQIDDIRDPSTANASFSKTVNIPSTPNNNQIFGNLFDINTDFTVFNPNVKTNASIVVNGTPVLEGYFQLTAIVRDFNSRLSGNSFSYNVVFYENTVSVFNLIKDQYLIGNVDASDDLDISALNHTLDQTDVEASWTNTWNDGYVYFLPQPNGLLLKYGMRDMKPALFHKKLVEIMFSELGYTLGGTFWDSNTRYEKEIIPFSGLNEEEEEQLTIDIEDATFEVNMSGHSSYAKYRPYSGDKYYRETKFVNEISDPNNSFDTVNQRWTVTENGIYDLDIDLSVDVEVQFTQGDGTPWNNGAQTTHYYPVPLQLNLPINYLIGKTAPQLPLVPATTCLIVGRINRANGQSYNVYKSSGDVDLYIDNTSTGSYNITNAWKSSATYNIAGKLMTGYTLTIGDTIDFQFYFYPNAADVGTKFLDTIRHCNNYPIRNLGDDSVSISNYTFTFDPDSSMSTTVQYQAAAGDPVDASQSLPRNFKKGDLFSDIIKRYNLYVRLDKEDPKKILLDSRDDYYAAGTTLDWSDKKDYSVSDKITLLPELQSKSSLFTYTKDTTGEANKVYTKSTQGDIYGQKRIEYTNEFINGEKKIESPFVPTPLLWNNPEIKDIMLPNIEIINTKQTKPTILYYGGLQSLPSLGQIRGRNEWILAFSPFVSDWKAYNTYPYAGHFDVPTLTPSYDLNWGANPFYFIEGVTAPTDNLYNLYWANYINFIADGRMLTTKLVLTEVDIHNIKDDLNTTILINGTEYYINKIKDFNPSKDGLTEVELLKL